MLSLDRYSKAAPRQPLDKPPLAYYLYESFKPGRRQRSSGKLSQIKSDPRRDVPRRRGRGRKARTSQPSFMFSVVSLLLYVLAHDENRRTAARRGEPRRDHSMPFRSRLSMPGRSLRSKRLDTLLRLFTRLDTATFGGYPANK